MTEIATAHPEARRIEVWFQDQARIGQKGTLTRVWAEAASRRRAVRDERYQSLYIFGAICPHEDKGAALVMPCVNSHAMQAHLETIAGEVAPHAHAVVVLDQAGWHNSKPLRPPHNITLLPLPTRSPELNRQENVWAYLRKTKLANRTFQTIDALMDACCEAWNALVDEPGRIRSIGSFPWILMAQNL